MQSSWEKVGKNKKSVCYVIIVNTIVADLYEEENTEINRTGLIFPTTPAKFYWEKNSWTRLVVTACMQQPTKN